MLRYASSIIQRRENQIDFAGMNVAQNAIYMHFFDVRTFQICLHKRRLTASNFDDILFSTNFEFDSISECFYSRNFIEFCVRARETTNFNKDLLWHWKIYVTLLTYY